MDEIDKAQKLTDAHTENALQNARNAVLNMPKGVAGECEYCFEYSPRLVGSPLACARCRDKYNLG